MTAPNVEMIAASLRSCSLGGGTSGDHSPVRRPPLPPGLDEASDESAGEITVELNWEIALPFHWEQCLDMRTGEIYYINRETGVRTSEDPRSTSGVSTLYTSSSNYYYYYYDDDDDDEDSDEYSCSRIDSGGDYDEDDEDSIDTAEYASTLACTSSPPTSLSAFEDPADSGGQILVAAGCQSCFMYYMVPKRVDACPQCGVALLHLGRNGVCQRFADRATHRIDNACWKKTHWTHTMLAKCLRQGTFPRFDRRESAKGESH